MTVELPLWLILYPPVALVTYWPMLNGTAIFDDFVVLPQAAKWRWEWTWIKSQYRPLGEFSIAIQQKAWGTTRSLKLGNILIHVISAGAVQSIAITLGYPFFLAFGAGLLFLVHPLAVSTASYISGRFSLLSTCFGLYSISSLLSGNGILAVPLLVLSFLSKEDGLAFGIPVAAIAALTGQYWLAATIVTIGLAVLVSRRKLFRALLKGNGDDAMARLGLPVALKPLENALAVLSETITRLPLWAFGAGLSPYHGSGIRLKWRNAAVSALLVSVLICLFMAFPVSRLPLLLLLGPWLVYLVCPVADQLAEYRNYSMVAGIALGFSMLLAPYPVLFGCAIACFAARTFVLSRNWRDPIEFWTAAMNNTSGEPSRAWAELGAHHKITGKLPEAESCLRMAIQLNPKLAPAYENLGCTLAERGAAVEAVDVMRACTENAPQFARGWQWYGIFLESAGRLDEARAAFVSALDVDPKLDVSTNRLGVMDYKDQKFAIASLRFETALHLKPMHFEYLWNVGQAAHASGDTKREQEIKDVFGGQPLPFTQNMVKPTQ